MIDVIIEKNNKNNTQIFRTKLFSQYKNNVEDNVEMPNRILRER